MELLTINAYAKTNLHLEILDKREDGFHDLRSIFLCLDLHDTLTFRCNRYKQNNNNQNNNKQNHHNQDQNNQVFCGAEIKILFENLPSVFVEDMQNIPTKKNIVFKALMLFKEVTGFEFCGTIQITKRIPSGGGLGGGSADAAATLLALNKIFKAQITLNELRDMATELGSDVPFFIGKDLSADDLFAGDLFANDISRIDKHSNNHRNNDRNDRLCAYISGRGELIEYIKSPSDLYYLLLNPGFKSNTPSAFSHLDEYRNVAKNLPGKVLQVDGHVPPQHEKFIQSLYGKPDKWPFFNSFLESDTDKYLTVINDLKNNGANFATLCGSGSTCLGVFTDKNTAFAAYNKLKTDYPFIYMCP
ncbi:4-diphosphocytidyl-2-C-methyl-D-erythritol kinase [Spirochaetia bacterium]|nr:4-diphosphocytidyl-2-C-methyl-D-erythritol kinase [Spirochaetia bacterium]